MITRDYILYLEDMQESTQRIEQYLSELDLEGFKATNMVVDAVVRNFEVIGEASRKIPTEIQNKYPEIPWRKM